MLVPRWIRVEERRCRWITIQLDNYQIFWLWTPYSAVVRSSSSRGPTQAINPSNWLTLPHLNSRIRNIVAAHRFVLWWCWWSSTPENWINHLAGMIKFQFDCRPQIFNNLLITLTTEWWSTPEWRMRVPEWVPRRIEEKEEVKMRAIANALLIDTLLRVVKWHCPVGGWAVVLPLPWPSLTSLIIVVIIVIVICTRRTNHNDSDFRGSIRYAGTEWSEWDSSGTHVT